MTAGPFLLASALLAVATLIEPKGRGNGFQSPLPAFRWAKRLPDGTIVDDLTGQEQQTIGTTVYIAQDGERFEVPSGFLTDYASIPSIFWNIPGFDPEGPAKFPAVLHDYLYSIRGFGPYFKSRPKCDALFLEAMESVGVGWLNRHLIYWSVRACGGIWSMSKPWRKEK